MIHRARIEGEWSLCTGCADCDPSQLKVQMMESFPEFCEELDEEEGVEI